MKTIKFKFEKATKNTFKYEEVAAAGQPPAIGALYVQKWAFPTQPEHLLVTVLNSEEPPTKSNIMPASLG